MRSKQRNLQAAEDYKAFRRLGIVSGTVDNLGALALYSAGRGDAELTVAAGRRAAELSPGNVSLWINLGVYLYRAGELRESYQSFQKAFTVKPNHKLGSGLVAVRAMATYAEYQSGGHVNIMDLKNDLVEASRIGNLGYGISSAQLASALLQVDSVISSEAAHSSSENGLEQAHGQREPKS